MVRLVPSIDVEGRRAVKRVKGVKGSGLDLGDAGRLLEWLASVGFRKIHVVDLAGAERGRITGEALQLVSKAASMGVEVRVGGGLRSLMDAEEACSSGASEIVVSTLWASDPLEASRIAREASCRAVAAVEEKGGEVVVDAWRSGLGARVSEAIRHVYRLGFRRVMYTYVDAEGLAAGVDADRAEAVASLAASYGFERVYYAGGVRGEEDLRLLDRLGYDEAIVGMALYRGLIPVEVAVRYA